MKKKPVKRKCVQMKIVEIHPKGAELINSAMQDRVGELSNKLFASEEKVSVLAKQLTECADKLTDAQSEIAKLSGSLSIQEGIANRLAIDNEGLRNDVAVHVKRQCDHEAEKRMLQMDLQARIGECDDLHARLADARSCIDHNYEDKKSLEDIIARNKSIIGQLEQTHMLNRAALIKDPTTKVKALETLSKFQVRIDDILKTQNQETT